MIKLIKRYRYFLVLLVLNLLLLLLFPSVGRKSFNITWQNTLEMLSVIPPIFILLGLLDVWVDRGTMMKFMGKDAGFIGIIIAFILGSAAAGPLYAAFPVAGVLLKKGSKLSNVLFLSAHGQPRKSPCSYLKRPLWDGNLC
jgi:uncharacterized membrane protein YraQ (UPF0718 family)